MKDIQIDMAFMNHIASNRVMNPEGLFEQAVIELNLQGIAGAFSGRKKMEVT